MLRLAVLLLFLPIIGGAADSTPMPDRRLMSADAAVSLPPISKSFCPGNRFSIKTPPLSSEPYIELTVGGKTGPFLIDYGATNSSVEKGLLASGEEPVMLTGPDLPGLPARNQFAVSDRNIIQPGVGEQLGVIGTDLLSQMVVELRYENSNDEHLVVSPHCDTRVLADRGFWRFDQKGFFSANPAGQRRANVPVLHIDFQSGGRGSAIGVKTWAQIDPGYGDAVRPYAIDINDAYYARLVAAQVPLVEIDRMTLSDCQGIDRIDRVYVMPGHLLRIETREGEVMYRQPSFYLVRKGKSSSQCGGIATVNEPAAQFGSSFLRVFGRVIFDPAQSAVWILPTTFRERLPAAR